MNASLKDLLVRQEGIRLRLYKDSVGKWTIGIGHNIDDLGITMSEALMIFEHDVDLAIAKLKTIFPGFEQMAEARQNALTSMMFNMGATRFCGFKQMIAAVKDGRWADAAGEMRHSLWASQLPARVAELARMMEQGE